MWVGTWEEGAFSQRSREYRRKGKRMRSLWGTLPEANAVREEQRERRWENGLRPDSWSRAAGVIKGPGQKQDALGAGEGQGGNTCPVAGRHRGTTGGQAL